MSAEALSALVLVAALRYFVAEDPRFLGEAFGDEIYALMTTLTTLATGDPDADRAYWEAELSAVNWS